jgi:enamine deaminase RidA (YjgF/YER057c/UK114 family)
MAQVGLSFWNFQWVCSVPIYLQKKLGAKLTERSSSSMSQQMSINAIEHAAGLPATAQYQYADRVGNQLFIAGQVPHNSQGLIVGLDDPHAQALQCLSNLNTLLAVHDFSTSDIRQLVVYVVGGQATLSAAWKTVADYFGGHVPPATLLGVASLGYAGQLVEVHATVLKA